ncbi:MAG: radical SAM protein [Methanomicrobiaceae archaeon]|nr:radical SAM protein [Methanomicrobiaceae archaeon]
MNVLFIYTNINGTHEDTYAFGLASLVSMTKKEGHNTKVLIVDNTNEYNDILSAISQFKPDLVGLTSVSSQFQFVKEITSIIKKHYPEVITVCGGVHSTIFPECILEADSLDAVFRGESEYSFVELLEKIEKKESYMDLENLCYVNDGKLVTNPLKPLIIDLESLPFPDKTTYPYDRTVNINGIAPFLFSRGCPFLCNYCSNHAIAKAYNITHNTSRYRSAESSIREIEDALESFPQIKVIRILDDIFGMDKEWSREFCTKYKERIGLKFDCCLRVNVVNEEFIKQLKDAGCYRIQFGVESGNEFVRKTVMNRNMSNDQIILAFKLAKKYGIETNAINIIGVPEETEEMIWDTIRLNRALSPTSSGVNIFYPYKGTKLGDYCFKEGLVNESLYEDFSFERRDTVLNYPEDYKKKLRKIYRNWDVLIYPFDPVRRMKWLLMKNPFLWNTLRKIKNSFLAL